jgi:hypothetical protein
MSTKSRIRHGRSSTSVTFTPYFPAMHLLVEDVDSWWNQISEADIASEPGGRGERMSRSAVHREVN